MAALALVTLATPARAKPTTFDPVTMVEIARLPQYCLGSFRADLATRPEQNITGCGVWVNHYCGGLAAMNRIAEPHWTKDERKRLMSGARDNINYTLRHLPANCPISGDVRAADQRLRLIEQVYK